MSWLAALGACQLAAYWHSWRWLYGRAEELVGLLAVAAVIAGLAAGTALRQRRVFRFSLLPLMLLLLLYGLCHMLPLPPILRAAIACLSLSLTLHLATFGRPPVAAYWGMVLCALPVVPSLQFYLGYPARLLSAGLTVPLLNMNGLAVRREGTYLVWQNQMLQFDAPCSGVTMLWAGLLLTFSVAYLRAFSFWMTLQALGICAVFIICGNVLRAASLFYLETGLWPAAPHWWHEGVGVMVFLATAAALLVALNGLRPCWRG